MNRVPIKIREQALHMLLEGSSMRATARITGMSFNAVTRLIVGAGKESLKFHNEQVRELESTDIQCDEMHSFVYAKQRNIMKVASPMDWAGDVWTWTAIDANSKLLISFLVDVRGDENAVWIMRDIRDRLEGHVRISTDGLPAYKGAVEMAWGPDEADYVMHIKKIERDDQGDVLVSSRKVPVQGSVTHLPTVQGFHTSYIERHNLTLRECLRRYSQKTLGFSKKIENLRHMVAIFAVWYNWIRPHKTLTQEAGTPTTPAMAAGLAVRPFTLRGLIQMMDDNAPPPRRTD